MQIFSRHETWFSSAALESNLSDSERRLSTLEKAVTRRVPERSEMRSCPAQRFVYACCAALLLIQMSSIAALGGQTREECNECCNRAGYDQYYEEQCKLKCFRNHDHCISKGAQQAKPAARAEKPNKEPATPNPQGIRLAWPNPLNLVAGKEGEAAARILAVNGISPQHPFYNAALQDIQVVLIDFVRKHPQGGQLPTTQLKRILRQLK